MGETGGSRRNPGLSGSAKNVIGPVNLAVIFKQHPRSEIRADNGRVLVRKFRETHSYYARPLRNTPFFWNACCRGMILGESGDSGHVLRLDARAKIAVSSTIYERFLG